MKTAPLIIVLLIGLGILGYVFLNKQNDVDDLNTQDESSFVEEENNAELNTNNNQTQTNTNTQTPSTNTTLQPPVAPSTGLPGPILTTDTATNVSASSATLNATILGLMDISNSVGQSSYFEYGTSSANLNLTSSSAGPTQGVLSKTIDGLQSNTTYYYRVVVNFGPNSIPANSSHYGNVMSFKTDAVSMAQGNTTTIMVPVLVLEESNYSTADFGRFGCTSYIKFIPQQVPETQAVLNATYEWLFNNNYQTSQYSNIVPTQQTTLNYQSVEIVNGVAKVYLTGSVMEYGCAFAGFAGQIEQAALQYPTVSDIEVYLNGQLFDWCSISQADPEEDGCDTTPKLWNSQRMFETQ